ncbi:MAG: hypothetical protein RO257_11730 [Candidatus Kapabacteria bacterium]|nr:hypothetical protein [Candidatus Kapabacteria bacterium]
MKLIYLFYLLIFLIYSSCQNKIIKDCDEKIIFENQLKIIENFVVFDSLDVSVRRIGAVHFLEMITGIGSESDANFVGKMNPTRTDYLLWYNWYIKNGDSLCEENFRIKIDTVYKIANPD